jgi:uncharacterized membrane protein
MPTSVVELVLAGLALFTFFRVLRLEREIVQLRRRVATFERQPPPPPIAPVPPVTVGELEPDVAPPLPSFVLGETGEEALETLEGRIGGRLLLYAGMIVLVLGVAFFLRYAFEHDWMSPAVRVTLGVLAGSAIALFGYKIADRYRTYGLFLCGGGIALLYLSIYAAVSLYGLVPEVIAFVVLVAITAAGAILADRTQSQPLALMAVCGGYLVPFLVGGERDAQLTLFSYDALLVAATMFLALRRDWPWLNIAALVFTSLTVVAWADQYYTRDKYLRTEIFLTIYAAMFVAMLSRTWWSKHQHAHIVNAILCLAPIAYHLASVVILTPHGFALPVYLLALTVVTVIGGLHVDLPVVRLVGWVAVALPLYAWISEHQTRTWVPGAMTTVVAVFVVHLAAQLRGVVGRGLAAADIALLHANGIGVFVGIYEALSTWWPSPWLAGIAVVLAALNAGLWAGVRRVDADAAFQWAGVAFTLIAIAVALEFDGPWAIAMWAAEGLAVAWVALQSDRPWLRIGAAILFALALQRWFRDDVQQIYIGEAALLNPRALTGLFIVGLLYVVAWSQKPREGDDAAGRERAGVMVTASALTVFAISKEIIAYWELQTSAGSDAYLARELMLSGWWAAYAAALVVIGIRRRYAPIRYFAIVLFGLTLGKVFLVDLGLQGGIYRVVGFVAIGVILLIVSYLYQLNPSRRASSRQRPHPP